ncbi:MAG: hypothetical protein GXY77_18900, partial [Fibrobacter sp.]|nr:hypothetical protein [Fibrobacter sp.]
AGQYLNPYGYSTNPVIMVDPDGNYFIGAIIGGAIGFAAGGLIGGAISGEDWSWSGALQGMMMGASLGSGIENSILASRFGPGNFNLPKTAYGRRFMLDMYKPILARGANFLPEENTLVEVKDPKFSNNVQRMNKRVLKNYLKANSESIGSHEVMQYAEMKDGKYSWIHEIGETIGGTEVTSVLRPDVSRFYDITHTHPGGGIPTGYPQSSNGFIATTAPSDMNLAKTAIRNKFTGTFHVYDIPNNLYYGFYPSSSNSLMLNYWQILGP